MPAKGQDVTTSQFLAQLIGPVLLAGAIGMLANPTGMRAMAHEFLRSPALIYLSGLIVMAVGVAIVLTHNVWAADWRVLITLFGWAAAIGGAFRIILPGQVRKVGEAMLRGSNAVMTGAALVWLAVGALFCFVGYFR